MAHAYFIHPSAALGFLNKYLEICGDPLVYKYLAENIHLPQASLPRGNAQAGILHIYEPHHKE